MCACQSDTNGSILYDHAKYVIFLEKLQLEVITCTISTFLGFLIVLKLIFFCTNNSGMIPWFSKNHNVAGSDVNSITYLTIAYKRNYVLQKLELNKD